MCLKCFRHCCWPCATIQESLHGHPQRSTDTKYRGNSSKPRKSDVGNKLRYGTDEKHSSKHTEKITIRVTGSKASSKTNNKRGAGATGRERTGGTRTKQGTKSRIEPSENTTVKRSKSAAAAAPARGRSVSSMKRGDLDRGESQRRGRKSTAESTHQRGRSLTKREQPRIPIFSAKTAKHQDQGSGRKKKNSSSMANVIPTEDITFSKQKAATWVSETFRATNRSVRAAIGGSSSSDKLGLMKGKDREGSGSAVGSKGHPDGATRGSPALEDAGMGGLPGGVSSKAASLLGGPMRRVSRMGGSTQTTPLSHVDAADYDMYLPPQPSRSRNQDKDGGTAPAGPANHKEEFTTVPEDWLPTGVDKPEVKRMFSSQLTAFANSLDLARFYSDDDNKLISEMSERAAELSAAENTTPTERKDIIDMAKVGLYDTVVFCDDSWSMDEGTRIAAAKELIRRVTTITTRLDPGGIKLRFFNFKGDGSFDNIKTTEEVNLILGEVRFQGPDTRIGTQLKAKILEPLVFSKTVNKELLRPLLVTIVTDGAPKGEETECLKNTILECRKTLKEHGYPTKSVIFQVSQVGDDREAEVFIGGLRKDQKIKKMVYCTSAKLDTKYEELIENERSLERWLLDLLLQGVDPAIQSQNFSLETH